MFLYLVASRTKITVSNLCLPMRRSFEALHPYNLLLYKSRRYVDQINDNERTLVRHIVAVHTNELAQWSYRPRLDHPHHLRNNADKVCDSSRNADRKTTWVVPGVQIVLVKAHLPEDDVLAEQDYQELRRPVFQQAQNAGTR